MNKLFVVLACMVGMTAAGIWDRSSMEVKVDDRRRTEQIDTDRLLSMTQDELLRQKFLLDILMRVDQPLIDERLQQLGQTLIVDQDKYQGQIDDEMVRIIEMCRNQRLLGKKDIFTITDEDHLRQMIGLYRMLVRSRDWDTFQRNACFARIHINGVLFVNSMLLAVRDRQDTRNLIVPAIHELLPELFYEESLVRKIQNMDINMLTTTRDMQTQKPGWIEMIGMGRRQPLGEQQMGILERQQLWMPWREMRLEMAMRRTSGEPTRTLLRRDDKLVLPVEQRGTLLTEDVGLNDLVHNLINELVLQEQVLQKDDIRDEQRLGLERVQLRRNEGGIDRLIDQRRRMDDDDVDKDDVRRTGMRDTTTTDTDRVLRLGRRRQNQVIDDNDMDTTTRWEQRGRIVDGRRTIDQHDDIIQRQRQQQMTKLRDLDRSENRLDVDDLPTTTFDDQRLLRINRRRLQDIDMRSDLNNQRERFMNIVRGSRISDGRRIVDTDRDMDIDMRRNKMSREQIWTTDDLQRILRTQNRDDERWMGRDQQRRGMRMDVMDSGRNWNIRRDERIRSNENIDELPTTDIDDERLLHVNRRRINSITRETDDDDDRRMREQMVSGRKNIDMRQRVGDERRTMWEDRNEQRRDRQPGMYDNDDTQKWQRTNRRQQQKDDTDNRRDQFMDMVRSGIRDGRKLWERNDDDSWTMRQRTDDERMQNKNDRRRWGTIERDEDEERMLNKNDRLRWGTIERDDDEERIQWNKRRGMEDIGTERWNINSGRENQIWNRRQHNDDDAERRMDIGTGMNNDRLLMTSRRRMRLNNVDNTDELTTNQRRRFPRSLRMDVNDRDILVKRSGEQLLYNLQQLMARINLERISLGITDRITDTTTDRVMNNQRLNQYARDERYALRLNEMRLDTRRNRVLLEQINRLEERLQRVLDQQLSDTTVNTQDDVNRVMGEVMLGKVQGTGLLDLLRELMVQERMDNQVELDKMSSTLRASIMRCPIMQHMLRRIVKIVDLQRQKLGAYKRDDIVLDGVRINDVTVDQLRTYVELDDTDLTNLLDQRTTLQRREDREQDQLMEKILVARQQRLNHKSFKINIDLTTDRDQRVVIRTMLLPKIDGDDRTLTLEEARLNALLIDATTTDLRAGRSTISRRSRDIIWTTRDTTPLTEIYRRVMRSIEGKRDMEWEPVVGNTCRLPHRLLLPRGRVEGLPMQLLVLITPLRDDTRQMIQQDIRDDNLCRIGVMTKTMDRLPLGFPLDRKIVNERELIGLPNLRLKDVIIYHDDKVNNNDML